MTQPPEYAPERTETQRLADDIATAMRNLRRDWPHMIRIGETQGPGWASRSGVVLDDHDKRDVDTRRIDRIISLRRFAMDQLNSWSRAVMDDRRIDNPKSLPLGTDVVAMTEFIERQADWLSGQDYGQDARDELSDLGHRCHLVAFPSRRESMSIGRCPLEIPGEQDVLEVCRGDVRYRLQHDERDGEAMAACSRCGEAAVVSWWEDRMFDDPETRRSLTIEGVVVLVHRQYGDVVKPGTIRQWVRRGILEPSSTDGGRTMFERDAVVFALDRWKRREALQSG